MDLNMAEGYKWSLETLLHEMLTLQASGKLNNYKFDALECLLKPYSEVINVDKLKRFFIISLMLWRNHRICYRVHPAAICINSSHVTKHGK